MEEGVAGLLRDKTRPSRIPPLDPEVAARAHPYPSRIPSHRVTSGRVSGDVAVPTPHRPGRADFPHPVLHGRG